MRRLRLDAISTGGTLSWAIETVEKGLLPEARALGLRFGNAEAVLTTIHAIAERRGIGALLAEGSRRAAMAHRWRQFILGHACQSLELPGYDPRSLKDDGVGSGGQPARRLSQPSGAYEADFSGEVDRLRGDSQRGAIVAASEDLQRC